MKRFILSVSLFLSPLILLAVIMEVAIRRIPNDYSYKNEYLNKHSNAIEVIVLGSSHVFYGIDPKYFKENTFNASFVSQALSYDYAILEKYQNNWRNLKCIVVPVDYFSLYLTLEDGPEEWRVKNYNIYFGIYNRIRVEDNFEILGGTLYSKLSRIYHSIKHESVVTCDSLGWGTVYHSADSKDLNGTGKVAALRHGRSKDYEKFFMKNVQTLNKIISFAKEKKVKLIFVTCPAYKSYTKNLEPDQLNTTIDFMNQLVTGNRNIYYYNLLNNQSFIGEDFYDADHLNEKGAKKLSLMVDSLINVQR